MYTMCERHPLCYVEIIRLRMTKQVHVNINTSPDVGVFYDGFGNSIDRDMMMRPM